MNNTFKEEIIYLESISELVFELNEEYTPNTVVAITETGINMGVNELGGKVIEIDGSLLSAGDKISIQYIILKEMGDDKKSIKIRELEEKVSLLNQKITDLEKAVNNALNKFEFFKVRLRKGFFWYYFEYNDKKIVIEEEKDYG